MCTEAGGLRKYNDLLPGGFIHNYKLFREMLLRLPGPLQQYILGYLYRSIEKTLLEDLTLLRKFCKTYLSLEYEEFKLAIEAMRLLGEFPGLMLAPSAAKYFETEYSTPQKRLRGHATLAKIRALVQTSEGWALKSRAMHERVFEPGFEYRSRTSPAISYQTETPSDMSGTAAQDAVYPRELKRPALHPPVPHPRALKRPALHPPVPHPPVPHPRAFQRRKAVNHPMMSLVEDKSEGKSVGKSEGKYEDKSEESEGKYEDKSEGKSEDKSEGKSEGKFEGKYEDKASV